MIRQATPSDISQLVILENECFTTDKLSHSHYRHLVATPSADVLVVEDQNIIIASAVLLYRKNSNAARIYSLAVKTTHRQQGVAKNLYEAMEISAAKRYSDCIILEVHPENTPAIRFYHQQGYVEFGTYERFYECGSDAIRMRKELGHGKRENNPTYHRTTRHR